MRKASPKLAARRKWVYYYRHFYLDVFHYDPVDIEDFAALFLPPVPSARAPMWVADFNIDEMEYSQELLESVP